jgi:hypothetical protein
VIIYLISMDYEIFFVNTVLIVIKKAGARTLGFTVPEGCSVPAEFKVGDEVEITVYPELPGLRKTGYHEIKHIASRKIVKVFYAYFGFD